MGLAAWVVLGFVAFVVAVFLLNPVEQERARRVDLSLPFAVSLGARVCASEADLMAALDGRTTAQPCLTSGNFMPARFLGHGENSGAVKISIDGVPGDSWVLRDALVAGAE